MVEPTHLKTKRKSKSGNHFPKVRGEHVKISWNHHLDWIFFFYNDQLFCALAVWKRVKNKMVETQATTLLGCPRKLGSMVRKWVISPTYKWGNLGVITQLLTFDPNFQRDIQVDFNSPISGCEDGTPANSSFMDSGETRGHGGRLSNKENLIELRTVLMHKKVIRKKHGMPYQMVIFPGWFTNPMVESVKKQSPEQQIQGEGFKKRISPTEISFYRWSDISAWNTLQKSLEQKFMAFFSQGMVQLR